jgi:hypothetical protein
MGTAPVRTVAYASIVTTQLGQTLDLGRAEGGFTGPPLTDRSSSTPRSTSTEQRSMPTTTRCWDLHEDKLVGTYDVPLITKGTDGKAHVEKHENPTQHGALGGIASKPPGEMGTRVPHASPTRR